MVIRMMIIPMMMMLYLYCMMIKDNNESEDNYDNHDVWRMKLATRAELKTQTPHAWITIRISCHSDSDDYSLLIPASHIIPIM